MLLISFVWCCIDVKLYGVSYFEPMVFSEVNNLWTLCGVVVYHLAIQWNLSNMDTEGTEQIVCIREVSVV